MIKGIRKSKSVRQEGKTVVAHKFGESVCSRTGKRKGIVGKLVDSYYTINGPFKNQAYVIEYPDGKRRSFQAIDKVN